MAVEEFGNGARARLRHRKSVAMPLHQQGVAGACDIVHGSDFVFVGKRELLQVIASHMADKFKAKVAATGPRATRLAHVEQEQAVVE